MKNLIPIFLIVILSLSKDRKCVAQTYAPKDYYLVDSLDLDALTDSDKELIETSLKKYHKAKHDTDKVNALNGICENMQDDAWIKYQYYQHELIEKELKKKSSQKVLLSLKKSLAGALNNIGYIYDDQGSIEKALEYYHKSLKLQEELGDKYGIAISLNNIGIIYQNQGTIEKALEYYHKSLKLKEELGDKEGVAMSLNNIGYIYGEQGDIEKALEYNHKSLKLREELGDKRGIAISLNNIGYTYGEQGDIAKQTEYHHKALKLYEELGDKRGIAISLNNIGYTYGEQGDIAKQTEYYHKSLKLYEELGDKKGIAMSLNNIGNLELKQAEKGKTGALASAENHLKKGLQTAQEGGYPRWISDNSENLCRLYKITNRYKEALEMYQLHIQMRDSINNEETQKATLQQQAKYEYEKQKAVDDKEHEKQLAIEQEAKEKQQVITYATAGGLGLVAIFLIFVFNRLQVTKKQKNIIEEQKQEVEAQKQIVETAHHELEEKNQEILDSINYAKRIQNAILPPQKVVKEYLQESFILYKPKDIVAGDFYWLESVPGLGKNDLPLVLFAACDCTGHGVPGAMVSVVCNNGLNRSVREYNLTDPGKILDKSREIVIQEFEKSEEEVKDGMDIALCSLHGNTLHYAGANNPLWIIRKGAEEIEEIKADKQPIGKYAEPTPYTTHKIELEKGDTIYIFSDGYADQFGGEKGKKFKAANFKKLLLSIQKEPIEQQREIINQAFEDWKGDLEQLDDVCVIGVRI